MGVQSFFHKPRGMFDWVCTRCGRIVSSEEDAKRMGEHYAKDPKAFLKAEKKFVKQMKKLKLA